MNAATPLAMRDRNGSSVHQTRGKLRIVITNTPSHVVVVVVVLRSSFVLLFAYAGLRLGTWVGSGVDEQGLPSLTCHVRTTAFSGVHQRGKVPPLLLVIWTLSHSTGCRCGFCGVEIVIGLAQDSRLLDRADYFTRLCVVAVPSCFYFHCIVIKSGIIWLFIIPYSYHCIVLSSVGSHWELLCHIAVVSQDSSILVVECASNCSIGSLAVILLDFQIEFDSWIHLLVDWFIFFSIFDKPLLLLSN